MKKDESKGWTVQVNQGGQVIQESAVSWWNRFGSQTSFTPHDLEELRSVTNQIIGDPRYYGDAFRGWRPITEIPPATGKVEIIEDPNNPLSVLEQVNKFLDDGDFERLKNAYRVMSHKRV